ncbi:hypothetical protein ACHWQZ_G009186 [Mnemiopsis leidyi]
MDLYVCVLDFEATCWDSSKEHEIIEFPSLLWRWSKKNELELVDEIQIFVKPYHNPNVSLFCHNLTGITQEQVDNGVALKDALKQHHLWICKHVPDTCSVVFVTCGDWDLKTMLPNDLSANNLSYPSPAYRKYLNIKQAFSKITQTRKSLGMLKILRALNLDLEGRHHSGIDDCRNISKIFFKLVQLGLNKDMFEDLCVTV